MDSITKEVISDVIQKKRKCIFCEEEMAEFYIKGAPKDRYCKECALEHFSSLDCLEKF
ncbi:MAG: hypothetical protein KKF44_08135 [Nanoarchaeota archaeon]|nr:hypothetical protein [Nanoarchaeota archaeon]